MIEQARKEIKELTEHAKRLIDEATEIAKSEGLSFSVSFAAGGWVSVDGEALARRARRDKARAKLTQEEYDILVEGWESSSC